MSHLKISNFCLPRLSQLANGYYSPLPILLVDSQRGFKSFDGRGPNAWAWNNSSAWI